MVNAVETSAFDLYLEGQRIFSIITRQELEAAADRFRRATEISSQFARAWGHWAYCLAQIVVAGHAADESEAAALLAEAEGYARRAVDIDGNDYANRWDLAFILLNREDFDGALAEYDRALELFDRRTDKVDRRNDLMVEMAEAHIYAGNTQRALELLDRATRIPDWYRWIRAWALFNARDYAGASAEINAMHKSPGQPGYVPDIQLLLAAAEACAERDNEAQAALQRLRAGRPGWTLARELARNPFRDYKDRAHWENAMKRAGFS